jgi:hypothetical protein
METQLRTTKEKKEPHWKRSRNEHIKESKININLKKRSKEKTKNGKEEHQQEKCD